MRLDREIDTILQDHPRFLACYYDFKDERFVIKLHAAEVQVAYLRLALPMLPDEAIGHVRVEAGVPMVAQSAGAG